MKRWLFILLLPLSVSATNYYVSAGSGSDSNDGLSTSTPFKHISEVCSLSPGDTAFLAGTFPPESTFYETWTGYITLYPQSSGTAGNEIVYKTWHDSARAKIVGYINTCANSADCFQSTILNSGTNYIVFDSLETKWGYRGIHISSGSHITVQYCLSYLSTGGDNNNTGNIYIGPGAPSWVTIRGNTLYEARESYGGVAYSAGGFNTGGVYAEVEGWDVDGVTFETISPTLYGSQIIVEENIIYNQGGWGIRLKRMIDSAIVRNNTIYSCGEGMAVAGAGVLEQQNYGNIVFDCGIGLVVMGANNTKYASGERIGTFNNTVYDCSGGYAMWTGSKIAKSRTFNNVFHSCGSYTGQSSEPLYPESLWFNWNDAYNCAGAGYFAKLVTTYASLAAWRGNSYSYILGKDSNSITSDPLFTDAAGHDFTLQAGSPALSTYLDTTFTLWTGEEITVDGMGAFNVFTDGVARDSTVSTPGEEEPHTPIQRRTGNVKTTGDKVIIE